MYRKEWLVTLCKAFVFFGVLIFFSAGLIVVHWQIDHQNTSVLALAASLPAQTQTPPPARPTPSPSRAAAARSTPPRTTPPRPTTSPTATPVPAPAWSADAEAGLWTYSDMDMQISVERRTGESAGRIYTAYIADIVVSDMSAMRAILANDKLNSSERAESMAERANAVVSINGDYYGFRSDGIIVRNGEIIRAKPAREMAAIYSDGEMVIVDETDFDTESALTQGLLHTYSFGPGLVMGGQRPEKYVSSVTKANPRTAIGMIEPMHFVFVVVDGRSRDYSNGMAMDDLGQFMLDLGCVDAYNLDGGASSEMCFMGETINRPSDGGRRTSDILYIAPLGSPPIGDQAEAD